MVLFRILRHVVGGHRGSFRLAITLCGLFFAALGLSYYVIILGGFSRGSEGKQVAGIKSCIVIVFEFGSVPSARTESADL